MAGLAMTADQVAAELEYFHRDGSPNGDVVRRMYRDGEFPAPIDSTQPVQRWRWARARVEQYVAGEWQTAHLVSVGLGVRAMNRAVGQ